MTEATLDDRRAEPRDDDGWVTFTRSRLPNGRMVLTQKRDGCTRSIIVGRA